MSDRAEALALARAALPYFQEQWERVPNQTTRARLDSAIRTLELLGALVISYEAVESGAKVLIEDGRYGVPWGDASEDDRAEAMARVRAILEAAAPHALVAA